VKEPWETAPKPRRKGGRKDGGQARSPIPGHLLHFLKNKRAITGETAQKDGIARLGAYKGSGRGRRREKRKDVVLAAHGFHRKADVTNAGEKRLRRGGRRGGGREGHQLVLKTLFSFTSRLTNRGRCKGAEGGDHGS